MWVRSVLPAAAILMAAAAPPLGAKDVVVPVPSGQPVTWIDTVQGEPGPAGLTMRFRFLAPAIARQGGTITPEQAQADMQALCDGFALDRVPVTGPQPGQIVISLADRPVEFGAANPEATQFFEAYSIIDGACVWEVF
jgi:hypothetical protein